MSNLELSSLQIDVQEVKSPPGLKKPLSGIPSSHVAQGGDILQVQELSFFSTRLEKGQLPSLQGRRPPMFHCHYSL